MNARLPRLDAQVALCPCFDFQSMLDTDLDHENEHLMHELGIDKGLWDCDDALLHGELYSLKKHKTAHDK